MSESERQLFADLGNVLQEIYQARIDLINKGVATDERMVGEITDWKKAYKDAQGELKDLQTLLNFKEDEFKDLGLLTLDELRTTPKLPELDPGPFDNFINSFPG